MGSSMDILSLPSPSWLLKGFEWSNRCGATKAARFRLWTAEGGCPYMVRGGIYYSDSSSSNSCGLAENGCTTVTRF
jgi:hypothetical protein